MHWASFQNSSVFLTEKRLYPVYMTHLLCKLLLYKHEQIRRNTRAVGTENESITESIHLIKQSKIPLSCDIQYMTATLLTFNVRE